jgi:membrane associated rhomboid family serine protease
MRNSTHRPSAAADPAHHRPAVAARHGRLRAFWSALVGAIGAIVGLAPHVLHHVGLLAGTALIAGAGGTAVFGVLGLVASVPFLLRLRRRFGSWWAPAIGLVVFAVMFSVSAFVIGPAITGDGEQPGPGQPSPSVDHSGHHS